MELGRPQGGERDARVLDDPLGRPLRREVPEHASVDCTDDGYPLGTDDGDEHQVPHPDGRAGQGERLHIVTLCRAGAVDDRLDSGDRIGDAVARVEVARDGLDSVTEVDGMPGQHPDRVPGVPEPGDDEAAERAGAAGDEDGVSHEISKR